MPTTIRCPICETRLPASTRECPVCGAHLPETLGEFEQERTVERRPMPIYSPALGEDDLYAPRLLSFSWWGVLILLLVIGGVVLVTGTLAGGVALPISGAQPVTLTPFGDSTPVPTLALGGAAPAGSPAGVPSPTLFLPTLTPAPPPTNTPPPTDTPGPCEQVVQAGDTLISLASRCGHRHLDVIDAIVDLNGLRSPDNLQVGQVIMIPWPTPTPGASPEAATDDLGGDTSGLPAAGGENSASEAVVLAPPDVIPSPTLQPGVMWYTVQQGDTILSIAIAFNANVEILSQLNPEVTFSQCDFGMDSGGGNCIVNLYEGQRIRVPAPTPTPTLSPTPSGSETPTPTPTPTFNAPALLSPGDRALFRGDEIVTLRWVSTGILGPGEVYQLTVTDTTTGAVHTETTTDTFFIIPSEWQPDDGQRHTFSWQVAVGPADGRGGLASITFSTDAWLFYWDSP